MNKENFLTYLQQIKRYSPNTIISYRADLDQFFHFCSSIDIHNDKEITHKIIRMWIVSLVDKDVSTRSINRKITTLKSYFKYLLREELVSVNPLNKIIPPKIKKRLPSFIEESQMDDLLDKMEFGSDFEGLRNKLILEMFYCTGMRRAELISLKISNINFDNTTLKVIGKRNKERILPFNSELKKLLTQYIDKRKEISNIVESDFLFLTKKGKQIYPKLVYDIVNRYLSKVTTSEKTSPHVLRHTFATHMLNRGADLNAIKEILGHSNLAATEVYTHNSFEKLKQVYKQAHPRA